MAKARQELVGELPPIGQDGWQSAPRLQRGQGQQPRHRGLRKRGPDGGGGTGAISRFNRMEAPFRADGKFKSHGVLASLVE